MATPEAALIAALTGEATVSALVGSRVFAAGSRQDQAYPYVTFQRISTQTASNLNGPSTLDWPRFQIDVYADTGPAARAVADAIRAFIDAQERTAAGLTFSATFQDDRSGVDAETRKQFVSTDYFLWHVRG